MKIFQAEQLSQTQILNPNQAIKPIHDIRLFTFFESLSFPKSPHSLLGIYLSVYFQDLDPIKTEYIYNKINTQILKTLQSYLDMGCVELLEIKPALYFLIMIDVKEDAILNAIYNLKKDIEKRTLFYKNKEYHLHLRCGLYFSGSHIDAYTFYHETKLQYHNALEHDNFMSLYNSCVDDLDFE